MGIHSRGAEAEDRLSLRFPSRRLLGLLRGKRPVVAGRGGSLRASVLAWRAAGARSVC